MSKNNLITITMLITSVLLTSCGENLGGSNSGRPQNASIQSTPLLNNTQESGFMNLIASNNGFCALYTNGIPYCWGLASSIGYADNAFMPTPLTMPTNESSFSSITSNQNLSDNGTFCALTKAGQAYCWGYGYYGTLGNNTTTNSKTPSKVIQAPGVSFTKIVGGGRTMCALDTLGVAYCWGKGSAGEIGNNENKNTMIPTAVTMPSGVKFNELQLGIYSDNTVCGLSTLGKIYCWGHGNHGQIGNGNFVNTLIPTLVNTPVNINFKSITIAADTVCALSETEPSGNAYCWGFNGNHELGNNTTGNSSSPQMVLMPANTKFAKLVASTNTICGISLDDVNNQTKSYCWGYGGKYQIGNGGQGNAVKPVQTDNITNISSLSIGLGLSGGLCAITASGTYCWGIGDYGQIGNNTTSDGTRPSPLSLPSTKPIFKEIQTLASGSGRCGLTQNGEIYCWGYGKDGQIGNGFGESALIPTRVIPSSPLKGLYATKNFYSGSFCSLYTSGKAYCWGYGKDGQIGNGSFENKSTPTLLNVTNQSFQSIAASWNSFCGINNSGQVLCWGDGELGQLGNGNVSNLSTPTPIVETQQIFVQVIASDDTFCALSKTGHIYCWGEGGYGQIGNAKTTNINPSPAEVIMPTGLNAFISLQASTSNTFCAIGEDAATYCWGNGTHGQIGNNNMLDVAIPTKLTGQLILKSITSSTSTFCGIDYYSSYCWGIGTSGQIGNGQKMNKSAPQELLRNKTNFNQISAGVNTFCGLNLDGSIECWGDGTFGQIGNGNTTWAVLEPTEITLPSGVTGFDLLGNSSNTFCAVATNTIYCWGAGVYGTIGNNKTLNTTSPQMVASSNSTLQKEKSKFQQIIGSGDTLCAINNAGRIYCWGYGQDGAIGNGAFNNVSIPTVVNLPMDY